jgi:ABC-type uncharacterized transport system permease subunit
MILSSSSSPAVWLLAAVAMLAYAGPVLRPQLSATWTRASFVTAWVAHAAVLGLCLSSGRFGFGPAVSVMAWLVLSVYAVESYLYPRIKSIRVFALLGAAAVGLGVLFPGVMLGASGSGWIPLHGALGIASYGMLGVATVHAWLLRRADSQMRSAELNMDADHGLPLMTIERLMMAFSMVAFALLSATLAAGWLFGQELHGSAKGWFWNHKTVFSILAWAVMAVLILGRKFLGWRGKQAAGLIYGSAILLLLSYIGSRFVLEVLLQRAS